MQGRQKTELNGRVWLIDRQYCSMVNGTKGVDMVSYEYAYDKEKKLSIIIDN